MRLTDDITLAPMQASDWAAVRNIYAEGIATGHATFQSAPPKSWDEWCAHHVNECSVVARIGPEIAGWACLSPVSGRCIYRGVAEDSVYVAGQARGRGIGSRLLAALVEISERHDIWTLQAGIFPENIGSVRLHLAGGFREVGRRERIGRMEFGPLAGTWRDVLLLERRSRITGTK